jgi:hypothetical protein
MRAAFPLLVAVFLAGAAPAQEYDREPINYTASQPANPVQSLIDRVAKGEARLDYEPEQGYLRSLLTELDVPPESQMLVFSKTSMQRHRIAPRTPRALYFNDDVYVGYCQRGDVLEISVADPQLGAVFYTLDQQEPSQPQFTRQGDNCLICHGSSQTKEVPGHVVRSVFSDASGLPILASGTYRIDHTSPLGHRWGGWYVTGTHGSQKHLGNLIVRNTRTPDEHIDNAAGQNVTDLSHLVKTEGYLTPHSDIVALMVLEHQAEGHNRLTRASFLTRQAMHYQEALNRDLGEPAGHVWDSTRSRIKSACEPLVEYLLFSEEAKLTGPLQGTSGFAEVFAGRGPRDAAGRSLRDLDLSRRIFRYPCSYLVYSDSFAALPTEARDYVLGRMLEILSGADQSPKFAHLSADDRQAILEILRATLPNLPEEWQDTAVGG